jgi:hypothetical protein
MLDNKRFGVSIGHNDTDNVVRNNEVLRSGKTGIFLRQEHGPTFSPSRNLIEANRVLDSGAEDGVAVDIEGTTEEIIRDETSWQRRVSPPPESGSGSARRRNRSNWRRTALTASLLLCWISASKVRT